MAEQLDHAPASAIACTITPADLPERKRRWRRVLEQGLVASQRRPTGIELRICASEATRRELEELIDAERECCSFLAWALASGSSEIVLDISGPAGTEAIFDSWQSEFDGVPADIA
jgi:hypothetical protein